MKELIIKFEFFKKEEWLTTEEALKEMDRFSDYISQEVVQEVLDDFKKYFCTDDLIF